MLEERIGGRFDLPGEALDGTQLAAALAEALERPVRYEAITPAAFGEALRPHLGDHAALGTAGVYEMFAQYPPALSPAERAERLDAAVRPGLGARRLRRHDGRLALLAYSTYTGAWPLYTSVYRGQAPVYRVVCIDGRRLGAGAGAELDRDLGRVLQRLLPARLRGRGA